MPTLRIVTPQQEKYEVWIPEDQKEASIGRSSKNTIPISDVKLSRYHAVITRQDDHYVLADLGSYNGTYLNKQLLMEPSILNSGDVVNAGETEIVFLTDAAAETLRQTDGTYAGIKLVSEEDSDPSTITSIFRSDDLVRNVREAPQSGGQAERNISLLSVLNQATNTLITYRPLKDLLELIMKLVFDAIPAERGFLMLVDEKTGKVTPQVVWNRSASGSLSESINVSRTITRRVIEEKTSLLINDTRLDDRLSSQQSIILQGVVSAMCVPLWDEQKVIGLIYVDSRKSVLGFTDDMLKILTSLANVAAIKIENTRLLEAAIEKQRMEEELALAGEIQKSLLPARPPTVEGYEIVGYNVPTRQVGGDYYDYIPLSSGRLGITIADVSGKGTSASLLMASLRASLISLAETQTSIADLVAQLNGFICKSGGSNRYITFFYGQLDCQRHTFRYSNAGHNPPILLRANGAEEKLADGGIVLGLFGAASYQESEVQIAPGDCLILYTDGISETTNSADEEFGVEPLLALTRANMSCGIQELLDRIIAAVRSFQGASAQADDMTLVLLRRT